MRRLFALACALLCSGAAAAAQPPGSDAPPGTVVQSANVAFGGSASDPWRAVVSKALVGSSDRGEQFYQWYLSIYRPGASAARRLAYRAPGPRARLIAVVEKAHGANLWFPRETLAVVGAAALMGAGAQQLVVASDEVGADCGEAAVTVLRYDPQSGSIVPSVSVHNPCGLRATVVRGAGGSVVRLDGPYYAQNAALCCPTKPKAGAVLTYAGGVWRMKPAYFQESVASYGSP